MVNLELLPTDDLCEELGRRYPNVVMGFDREATPDGQERTYLTRITGEPFRCYFLAGRLQYQIQQAIDVAEYPEPSPVGGHMSRSAAIITIRRPNDMTMRGRKRIAAWMRKQAQFLEQYGPDMANQFTARYLYS